MTRPLYDHLNRFSRVLIAGMVCGCLQLSANGKVAPSNIIVEGGYSVNARAIGLDFPTAIALSADTLWVSEGGFVPGFPPKVKRIGANGDVSTILRGDMLPAGTLMGPLHRCYIPRRVVMDYAQAKWS
jgi:hypothetical protein